VTFEQASKAEFLDKLRALPKCELHLHLEGTIVPETLVALSQRHDAEPLTLEAAQALYKYDDFQGFLMAFKAVTQRLLTPEDYELVTYEMLRRLAAQGVVHAEVYVSVGVVYYWRKAEFEPLFGDETAGMERGRIRGQRDFGVTLYWIFDAVRHFGVEEAAKVFHKAAEMRAAQLAATGESSIVGIGIGGDERRGPAEWFKDLYAEAKAAGLRLTAHAGESAGPESIWAALNIGAERLGHCLTAQFDDELMEELAQRQVPVELCPSSNVATGCCRTLEEHPLRRYFESGLMVTLNSDDPPMFHTDLLGEYWLAHNEFELTLEQLREIASNSIEASFLPAEQKISLIRRLEPADVAKRERGVRSGPRSERRTSQL
jgi:adenosine deaminase/aminodeoxyfutalosine deaminase